MRASRLLQMLLLLQNRGRLTCKSLAQALEVTQRTVLRDVEALTEAGLPVIVTRGYRGGIELGFSYRTRLTGLSVDESYALAILLQQPNSAVDDLGLRVEANRAVAKLVESFSDTVRKNISRAQKQFQVSGCSRTSDDLRLPAMAKAIRNQQIVVLRANTKQSMKIHPLALLQIEGGWSVIDGKSSSKTIPIHEWGDISMSSLRFESLARSQ